MKGLYQKYIVKKADGSVTDPDAVYIVLRIDKGAYVNACRKGVRAFAQAVYGENQKLSQDLTALLSRLAGFTPDDDFWELG